MEPQELFGEEYHLQREYEFLDRLRVTSAWIPPPRVYWKGEIFSKDENKTYSFNVEGDTKELAVDRLTEMYAKGSSGYFKDKWVIKSIERCK